MFYEVIPTTVYRKDGGALTYSSDLPLQLGNIVQIPLGRRLVNGVVLRRISKVDFPTKPIHRLLHPLPIPSYLIKSMQWLAEYYLTEITETVNLLVPPALEARTALKSSFFAPPSPPKKSQSPQKTQNSPSSADISPSELKLPLIQLNSAQKKALQSLQEAPESTSLLRGVTGSGKTNIYLQLTANTLRQQKSVVLLVPEIALTGQLVQIFQQTFGERVTVVHSRQTPAERRQTWLKILESTANFDQIPTSPPKDPSKWPFSAVSSHSPEPIIVIGPRSALLTPVANLGLILIDEAHENAYFQENSPRYSALRLASTMARQLKIPCVLGSATPNIVDYYLAKTHHTLVELSEKAKATAISPKIKVIDFKERANFSKNRYFSNALLAKIEQNLQDGYQTLIFHNRRGSAPLTLCEECGWQALCPNCYLPMTLHTDDYSLYCHLCGHQEQVPKSCPHCKNPSIIHKGFGTKLLETELERFFPDTKIARFDGDNKKAQSLANLYDEVKSGEIKLLIGTQTLARGLDLPHLATVGIIQADAGLALPDYAAEERSFELLTQVIGRVGRGHLDSASVIVQTYQPNHPVLQTALSADFYKFADYLLKTRRQQKMPPFTYLARLSITYKTEKTALAKVQLAHQTLSKNSGLILSPPMPAFHERISRGYTWQITVKSTSRSTLLSALRPFLKLGNHSIIIDPPSLL